MTKLPRVDVMVCEDFELDMTRLRAYQRWNRPDRPSMASQLEIPIKVGKFELIEHAVAHRYLISYMNAMADRLIADGFAPWHPCDESRMAQPIKRDVESAPETKASAGRCVAGVEIPRGGACPACGAMPNQQCRRAQPV